MPRVGGAWRARQRTPPYLSGAVVRVGRGSALTACPQRAPGQVQGAAIAGGPRRSGRASASTTGSRCARCPAPAAASSTGSPPTRRKPGLPGPSARSGCSQPSAARVASRDSQISFRLPRIGWTGLSVGHAGVDRSTEDRAGRYGAPEGGRTSLHVILRSARLTPWRGSLVSAWSVRYVAGVVVVGAGCYAFAEGGKALLLTGPAGAFWPAGGLALGVPPGAALAEAAGDMARAIVAVVILRRLVGSRVALDRLRQVGGVLVAV